jgi:hypothetical protein
MQVYLKVLKCEIFDILNFVIYLTTKPFWVNDVGVEIEIDYFNIWGE